MSISKKHHYLPIFYSSRWSDSDGKLLRYYRPYGSKVVANRKPPSRVGYQDNLYGALEEQLMKSIDDLAAKSLNKMESLDNCTNLSEKHKMAWSRFIVVQQLRLPQDILQIENVIRTEWKKRKDKITSDLINDFGPRLEKHQIDELIKIREDKIDQETYQIIKNVIPNKLMTSFIMGMSWEIINTENSQYDLLTSDNPIYSTGNFESKKAFLMVPIGRYRIFVAANSKRTIDFLKKHPSDRLVKSLNKLTVQHAVHSIFSFNEAHRRLIENNFSTRRYASLAEQLAHKRKLPVADPKSPLFSSI